MTKFVGTKHFCPKQLGGRMDTHTFALGSSMVGNSETGPEKKHIPYICIVFTSIFSVSMQQYIIRLIVLRQFKFLS